MESIAIIIPVYNEAEIITIVLESWLEVLSGLNLDFHMFVINDGSTDQTWQVVSKFQTNARITLMKQANSGHGPSIYRGYQLAASQYDWVFQTDSDNEIQAQEFLKIWEARSGHDAVLAMRTGRQQSMLRSLMSGMSRWIIRSVFGSRIPDVNAPFRLMKGTLLTSLLTYIPPHAFAPNLMLTALMNLQPVRLHNVAVILQERTTGVVSISGKKAVRVSIITLWQMLNLIPRLEPDWPLPRPTRLLRHVLHSRFVRYSLIGLCGASLDYVVFLLLTYLGIPYLVANALGCFLGMSCNFQLNLRFNFKTDNAALFRFASWLMIGFSGLGLSSMGLVVFIERLYLPIWFSKLLVMVGVVGYQYVLNSRITFRK